MARPVPEIPTRIPFVGHFLDLVIKTPWTTMMRWVHTPERVSAFKLFGETYILIADPDLIRCVLATHIDKYRKDPRTYAAFKPILGNGLIISEGELWKRQRSILGRAFRAEILGHVVAIADEAAARLIEELEGFEGRGVPFDFAPAFRKLTLQVIADAVLSLSPEESDQVLPKLYLPIVEEANVRTWMPFRSYLPTPGNFAFRRASEELDAFVTELIERRKRDGNRSKRSAQRAERAESGGRALPGRDPQDGKKDILDRIIAGHQESGEPWDDVAVAQLRDEVKTFLMAGHETSSMMLTWALYEIARHPSAMEMTIAEANRALPRGVKPSQEIALKGLEYTEAVLRESLRRYSLVPVVTREAIDDDELGGFAIPKGAKIVVAIEAVHHDEKLWPDPTAFRPERFLAPLPHPYAFLSFLAGPRNCIGEHFSLIEAKIVLARLVQRFRFLVASKEVGTRHQFKAPLAPATPMHLFVEEHAGVRKEVEARA